LIVSALCNNYVNRFKKKDKDIFARAERIIYTDEKNGNVCREIDHFVHFYQELEIDKNTGVQLILNVPIECKNRKNCESFSFIEEQKLDIPYNFIISSTMNGSEYFKNLIDSMSIFSPLKPSLISILEIENGKNPKKTFDEQIVYNAGTSLYDFIQFDLAQQQESDNDNTIVNILFKEFNKYLSQEHYAWWSVFRDWITNNISNAVCDDYNKAVFKNGRIYYGITAYLPLLCINGPIYNVKLDSKMKINGFKPVKFVLHQIRKKGWPMDIEMNVLINSLDSPIIITNPYGLLSTLKLISEWFKWMRHIILNASTQQKRRWPLESAFFRTAYLFYVSKEKIGKRSDLNIYNYSL